MGALDLERMNQIKQYLKRNPRGMTISDISSRMHMNRNLAAKYLDMLLISGQADMQEIGTAKVYFLSRRVPISSMLDLSSDMVVILDTRNQVQWVNESALAALGEDRQSVVGTCLNASENPLFVALSSHLPPADMSDWVSEMCCVLQGEECHFRVKRMPVVFEDGSRGTTLILEEITDEVVYRERLKTSEARYRGIVEDQTEFIVRCAPDGSATFVNGAYARYLNESAEHLVGKPFIPGLHSMDASVWDRAFRSLNRDRPVTTFECRVHHPSGEVRWNAWTMRAFFDGSGRLSECRGVGRDITEKREAAAKINDHLRWMEFFSQTCTAFMDMDEDDDIYEYVVRQVHSLAPGSLVWVSIIVEPTRSLVLKGRAGDPAAPEGARHPPVSRSAKAFAPVHGEDLVEFIRCRSLVKIPPFSRLLDGQVPGEIQKRAAGTADEFDTYLMGLVSKGRLIGSIGILFQRGATLPNKALIEALIRQAAIAIDRRIANDTLKKSLAREQEQVRNLQFLSRTAMDFVEMDDPVNISRYIADRLSELIPESLIGIFSFDPGQRVLTLRAVAGDEGHIAGFWKALGINSPLGLSFPISELPRSEADLGDGRLFEVPSVYDSLFHQIPQDRCIRAEEELQLGRGFCMGFTYKGKIFGSVLIGLFQKGDIENRELVEAFLNQASVALLRRCARECYRESDELFRLLVKQMPYPVFFLGCDGRILGANKSAATLVGCHDAAELAGRSFYEYVDDGVYLPSGLLRDLASGGYNGLSCRLRMRSAANGTCDLEAWGRMVRYNRRPALYLGLRPFSSGGVNGTVPSSMSGGIGGL